MDYSVFRRKKPATKTGAAPPPPPAAAPAPKPTPAPEPTPRREGNGHRHMGPEQYMSDWGGEGYMDMDRFFSNRRINNIDIASAQRVRVHFRDYDEPDASYYDVRTPFCTSRYHDYPDHRDNYGYGHWPAALPPPRAATGCMLPPPPPPSQRYYGHGYEHQYALPPPAAYQPSYFY